MLHHRAALRLHNRKRQLGLVDATAAHAGGKAAKDLFSKLGKSSD